MREGGENGGAVWWGEPEVTKADPTYYVNEGRIVTIVLRAPRTKGEFHMLRLGGGNFRRRREIFPPAGSSVSSFN